MAIEVAVELKLQRDEFDRELGEVQRDMGGAEAGGGAGGGGGGGGAGGFGRFGAGATAAVLGGVGGSLGTVFDPFMTVEEKKAAILPGAAGAVAGSLADLAGLEQAAKIIGDAVAVGVRETLREPAFVAGNVRQGLQGIAGMAQMFGTPLTGDQMEFFADALESSAKRQFAGLQQVGEFMNKRSGATFDASDIISELSGLQAKTEMDKRTGGSGEGGGGGGSSNFGVGVFLAGATGGFLQAGE